MNLYSHRSQAATEYLMTYGWAFLIIAIVAAILISLGVFSPSPSSTVTGFTSFTSASASVSKTNGLVLTLTNTNPNTIYLTNVSLSSSSGLKIGKVTVLAKLGTYSSSNPLILLYYNNSQINNLSISPGQSFTIIISNVSAYSSYSTQATITYYENGIPQSSTGTISGTPVSSSLAPKYSFPTVTFTESGLPSGTSWSVTYNGVTKSSTSSSIIFNATSTSESFSVPQVTNPFIYNASPSSGSLAGGSTQTISFTPPLINITNTQNVSTPNPFQQMINVSSSSPIWTYINTNQTSAFGQNVEFTYPNGTVIPSWLESYSSTHAIWWIKIGSIPANSKLTIYAKIAPKSTNLFNNKTTGEAPQLSSTYAEYDDGANVFNFYNNFAGTTLPSAFTAVGSGSYAVDNGITVEASSNFEIIASTSSGNNVIDALVNANSSTNGNLALGYGGGGSSYTLYNGYTINLANGYNNLYIYTSGTPSSIASGSWSLTTAVYTLAVSSSPSQRGFENYVNEGSATNNQLSLNNFDELAIGAASGGSIHVDWVRTRAYPPNGVMPSVSIG